MMQRIAIFLPNWIGDVVMATPAIRALRHHYPDAEIVAVCKPYVIDVIRGMPWIDRILSWNRKGPKPQRFPAIVRNLRDTPTDAAVLFPNSLRPALAAWFGGCQKIVGFARYGRDMLLSSRLYPTRQADGRPKPVPIIKDYNRIVQLLGVPDPGYRMELFTTPDDEAKADHIWQKLGLHQYTEVIGMNPGGAFGSAKHWPSPSFAELAKQLRQARNCGILILCGPSERDTAEDIVTLSNDANVMSLAKEDLSIGLTKAIVRRLQLLVTTDSGPRHFAAAFQKPVVSLFGPTHIGWTETYFPLERLLQERVPCGPCQLRTCPLDHRCMTQLRPMQVLRTIQELLVSSNPETRTVQELRYAS